MAKMDVINSPKFLAFSKDEQDVVKAGVDLYKHYLHLTKKDARYAEFATGKTYEEKEKIFNESLVRESFKRAGVSQANFSDSVMMQNPNVKWAMFALISEALSVIIPSTVLDNFAQFAEVRNVGWGDNLKFTVPNNDLFIVSKIAQGIRRGEPQRLYNSDLTLTPVPHEVTIQEDFYRILAGKINWGEWISRIAQSIETAISTDVYNAFYGSYANLNAKFKEAAFDKDAFVKLAQRVQASNRGARTVVFGTQIALSKVIPDADFVKFGVGLGEEYTRMGFLGNFMGADLYKLDQRIKPNDPDYNFAIQDDALYFVSVGVDRPVKIGFEGNVLINQSQFGANADNTVDHNVQQLWDVAVVSSAKHGIMKV
ncbi:hypothetical protein [Paenibacillus elgii]|uniref:hypothetical protein n=1 Tax=Paenibacillus elgii TaxID=189691 RepID=UPI000248CFEA|nr:hypothetical protein [Paenibacillus elgii]